MVALLEPEVTAPKVAVTELKAAAAEDTATGAADDTAEVVGELSPTPTHVASWVTVLV